MRRVGIALALTLAAIVATLAVGLPSSDAPPTPTGLSARAVSRPHTTRLPGPVVVLGDSVPAGTGCGCDAFGPLLARRIGAARGVRQHAQDGQTAAELADDLSRGGSLASDLRAASVVTVTVGANDFDSSLADDADCRDSSCFGPDLTRLRATLHTLLGRLRALTPPRARVLVTGYWNVFLDGAVAREHGPGYVATSDSLTRLVNSEIATAAGAAGATYVDLYRPFKGDGDVDDTPLLAPDGDHPSAAGHALIARLLAQALSS